VAVLRLLAVRYGDQEARAIRGPSRMRVLDPAIALSLSLLLVHAPKIGLMPGASVSGLRRLTTPCLAGRRGPWRPGFYGPGREGFGEKCIEMGASRRRDESFVTGTWHPSATKGVLWSFTFV
jgi:hypothetical protein